MADLEEKKFEGRQRVNLVVCYYHLDENKDRYVFFFYSKFKKEPIHKWVYYLIDNQVEDFVDKFNAEVDSKSFFINPNAILYMCNKDTLINTINLPNNLMYKRKFHQIIENDLKEKIGADVGDRYYCDNDIVRKDASVITYQQVLVAIEPLEQVRDILKELGIQMDRLMNLPSALDYYHKDYSKNKNEIVIYVEAAFILMIAFVENQITECIFMDENNHYKNALGETVNLHFQNIDNMLPSLFWTYQKEGVEFSNAVLICNSEKKTEQIQKKIEALDIPTEIINSTDQIFNAAYTHLESKITKGFTLVEVIISLSIFAVTAVLVATMILLTSRMNTNSNDKLKADVYIANVEEVFRESPTSETLLALTDRSAALYEENNNQVYYVNSNFDLFSPSVLSDNMTYKVSCTYTELEINGGENKIYTLKINQIIRVSTKKNLINEFTIEVTKWAANW